MPDNYLCRILVIMGQRYNHPGACSELHDIKQFVSGEIMM